MLMRTDGPVPFEKRDWEIVAVGVILICLTGFLLWDYFCTSGHSHVVGNPMLKLSFCGALGFQLGLGAFFVSRVFPTDIRVPVNRMAFLVMASGVVFFALGLGLYVRSGLPN